MRATDFEFRYRFWIIAALFFVTFSCYFLDRVNSAQALLRALGYPGDGMPLHVVFGVGALLAGAGALIRSWATAYLRTEIVHDAELHSEGIVADGPYRHLRNPLYLGNILLALAMGLVASRLGFVVLIAGTFVIFLRLIGREEAELLAAQGERYRAYRDAVPRLWPALKPRLPASGARPVWWQAFWGETLFWVLFLACVWMAVTFDARGFQVIIFVGLILYIVLLRVWKKRRGEGRTLEVKD